MMGIRHLGLAPIRREGWTVSFDGGKSYPPEVQCISEMLRRHTRRKTISAAMRDDAIKIFDMVKQAQDAI